MYSNGQSTVQQDAHQLWCPTQPSSTYLPVLGRVAVPCTQYHAGRCAMGLLRSVRWSSIAKWALVLIKIIDWFVY